MRRTLPWIVSVCLWALLGLAPAAVDNPDFISFGPGFYHDGDGKDLGHTIEFRSMIEAGYRFDDRSRLTAQLSHLSNASLGDDNPGVNVLGLYYHVPVSKIFGD